MTREEFTRKQEIEEMAKMKASHITSDKDMQVAFADALRSGAQWADSHPHWISVDELPKEKGWIIVSTFFNSIACPAYYYEGEDVEEFRSQGITHWMRLPQAPKGGEE